MPDESRIPAPEEVHASPIAFVQRVLDDMIARYGSEAYTSEIALARKDYDERRGRVFEDEELWETWTQAFLEWYVVERPASGSGAPPALLYAAEWQARAHEPDASRVAAAARAWVTSHRSLFEVRDLGAGQVELVDLVGGGHFSVAEQRAMAGVSIGDVAELRLLGFEDSVFFGRTFCFHPSGTRDAICAHIERVMRQGGHDQGGVDKPGRRRDIVDFCASLRIRCERYRHVSPRRIYETGTLEAATSERGQRVAGPLASAQAARQPGRAGAGDEAADDAPEAKVDVAPKDRAPGS